MINEKINLSEKYAIPGNAVLETFVHSDSKEMHPFVQDLPCMLVCPGGGYWFTSEREGEPIAIDFYNRNYNAFVYGTTFLSPERAIRLRLPNLLVRWIISEKTPINSA